MFLLGHLHKFVWRSHRKTFCPVAFFSLYLHWERHLYIWWNLGLIALRWTRGLKGDKEGLRTEELVLLLLYWRHCCPDFADEILATYFECVHACICVHACMHAWAETRVIRCLSQLLSPIDYPGWPSSPSLHIPRARIVWTTMTVFFCGYRGTNSALLY